MNHCWPPIGSYIFRMTAENHHYVPKFILRNFLTDPKKEQVSVFDKQTDRTFQTSIRNVMAETRFNEFAFDDNWIASFEPIACGAENLLLPHYRQVVAERKLSADPMQKAALAFLVAFQFLRTRAQRERWKDVEQMIVQKVEAMGGKMQDMKGWEDWRPNSEDDHKRDHLLSMRDSISEFTQIIASKDFLLAEATPDRLFYIPDTPVCLSNSLDHGPYGNLGLSVRGIEIYLPLSNDLMLCAWCPSILEELRTAHAKGKDQRRSELLGLVSQGKILISQVKPIINQFEDMECNINNLIACADNGIPISSASDNMDFYNSLQVSWATRYVVCPSNQYGLAKKFNREKPEFRNGRRFKLN